VTSARAGGLRRISDWLELVRFSHTIFALPFAAIALFLATGGEWPGARLTLLVLLCMVFARTAAMAYNRLVDRDVDAANPRTRSRHLPAGRLAVAEVAAIVAISGAAFVTCAFLLNPLAGGLSLPVLAVLLGYSHFKRFSALSHFVLGLALGLAPLAVFVAVKGTIDASFVAPALLGFAVLAWVAGFDLIYASQDVEFDRAAGLHSIPARIGIGRALLLSRLLHVAMVVLLALLGIFSGLGLLYWAGLVLVAVLLVHEHRLVRADDLSKVDLAFFTLNGVVSVAFAAFAIAELVR
jgi:4-hydroxybenzoate polyprenyltransferase